MRGLLISISGGIFIPLFLFAFTMMAGESLENDLGLGWVGNLLMFSFLGPAILWERVFPPPPSCPSCWTTDAAIVATIITDFLVYSILTYLVRKVVERLRYRDAKH